MKRSESFVSYFRILCILFLSTNYCASLYAQEGTFRITEEKGMFDLDSSLVIHEDAAGNKNIEEILGQDHLFRPFDPEEKLNRTSVYWGKLLLVNTNNHAYEWVLSPDWDRQMKRNGFVEVHIPQKGVVKRTGRLMPYSERDSTLQRSYNNQVLLRFEEADSMIVYIKVWQIDSKRPIFRVRLMDVAYWSGAIERDRDIMQAIFQGIIWMMLFYSLVLYWSIKSKAYVFYALFLFSASFYFLYLSGILYDTILSEYPIFSFYVWIFATNLLAISYFQFARSFLKTKTLIPFWDRIGKGFIYGLLLLTILEVGFISFTLNQAFLNVFNNLIILLEVIFLSIVSLSYIKISYGIARIFLLGTLCLVIAGFIGVILEFMGLTYPYLPLIQLFFILEVLTFSWGLSHRHLIDYEQRILQRAEAKHLRDINELRSRYFADISHEFRTPLTIITGMTTHLEKHWSVLQEAKIKQQLASVNRNGMTLLHLVNQILDLTKLEAQKMEMNWKNGDILKYLKILMEPFAQRASEKDITLSFHTKPEQLNMDFDEDCVQSIFLNLLSNALKFTSENGDIHVSVEEKLRKEGKELELLVKDSGKGIPETDLPHIFDRYFRSEVKDEPEATIGTGIGLALVQEQVSLLGGNIGVSSQPGAGSEFRICLPIHNRHTDSPWLEENISVPPLPSSKEEKEHQKPSIPNFEQASVLLIEDNEELIGYVKSVLSSSYRVQVARNGSEGIELAVEMVPDLIISDVSMPEKNGYEVCETIKQDIRTSHIPIILLTARASQEDKVQGLALGADAYMVKPFQREELLVRMKQMIRQRKALQSKFSAEGQTPDRQKKEHVFVGEVRRQIEIHLTDEGFTIDSLCKTLGMSQTQVRRKLKSLTGLTIQLFIREVRLEKAHRLLQSSDFNVSEVAYEVGFRDPAYFSRVFSEKFGFSPNTIRP